MYSSEKTLQLSYANYQYVPFYLISSTILIPSVEERRLSSKSSRIRVSWMSVNPGVLRFSTLRVTIKGCLNCSLLLLTFAGKSAALTTVALYSSLVQVLGIIITMGSQKNLEYLGFRTVSVLGPPSLLLFDHAVHMDFATASGSAIAPRYLAFCSVISTKYRPST